MGLRALSCVTVVQKIALAFIVVQAHNNTSRGHPCTRTHGETAGWVTLTLSDRFCTPTLIRPDNERWEKARVFQNYV